MRILIVEDDEANRKLLQIFLSPYGKCDLAENGEKGITSFKEAVDKETFYDLVCLDIMMPGIDGLTVLKKIRELEAQSTSSGLASAKVLMMTAVADKNFVINAFKEGCEAYLIKPLNRDELMRQLKVFKLIA